MEKRGKNMKRMLKKSKGFTLVELLIVVVIIGILAGMMMLSTGSATSKAEATKIVSNLRNMKAAAIMVYADTNTWPTAVASLDDYVDQSFGAASANASYDINGNYVTFSGVKTDVEASLKKMRETGVPLYQGATSTDYSSGATVAMPMK